MIGFTGWSRKKVELIGLSPLVLYSQMFARGSVMNFVLSVEQKLGPLTFLRIWHDNKGKGKHKSWYLDHVQVNDLQTGER